MFKNRHEVILLVYGKGGHTAQMERFLHSQPKKFDEKCYVALSNSASLDNKLEQRFYCMEARDKFSKLKNIFIFLAYPLLAFVQMCRILINYKVTGMISTGPGMAVIPALLCRLLLKPVVFFESWSRVSQKSIAGRVMCRIANLFFVQHKGMKKQYPDATYKGRL